MNAVLSLIPIAWTPYLKSIVALLVTAVTVGSTYYGADHWFTVVAGIVTVLAVYFTPNLKALVTKDAVTSGGTPGVSSDTYSRTTGTGSSSA